MLLLVLITFSLELFAQVTKENIKNRNIKG
jgi:hypothetical protein